MTHFLLLAQQVAAEAVRAELSWSSLAEPASRLAVAAAFALVGIWLLLPTGVADWWRTGLALTAVAGCLFASLLQPMGNPLASATFSVLLSVTVVAAVATITARSPVYSAIWFALTLLGTGGLFLLNGAHFLGVATVAVYAGAIVVTFLFVLMLAQPEGHAFYDRISWGAFPTALAVAAGVFVVVIVTRSAGVIETEQIAGARGIVPSEEANVVLNPHHVAALGGQLFTRHLISVQVAGALLLAALVGAVAIAGRDRLSDGRGLASARNGVVSAAATDHEPGGRLDA